MPSSPPRIHPGSNEPSTPFKAADPITLRRYLTEFRPEIPDIASSARRSPNTRSGQRYGHTDIASPTEPWPEFSLDACLARYGGLLRSTTVSVALPDVSPQKGIAKKALASEKSVTDYVTRALSVHLNRALEATAGCELCDRPGDDVGVPADRVALLFPSSEIRLVADIKVSWKWCSAWAAARLKSGRDVEFRQALSQVHCYMNAAGTRWGYILTDREFVAIQRDGRRWGDIKVAAAVAWETDSDWTVPLAAWFLHKLAAEDDGWTAPTLLARPLAAAGGEPDFGAEFAGKVVRQSRKRSQRSAATGGGVQKEQKKRMQIPAGARRSKRLEAIRLAIEMLDDSDTAV
ncbi:hypothetical protein FN846DRAFT_962338 [Sphaerosporella brunnea]|uniref:Uncharacterized protein n=1 Tax=Sphaerosporella brunnea TaxID=1250544 RepID=A0A5J5EP67_9PEZI|nr:hypothetical protein FN846DRAFT_962338 [Sphaerosporella brunnea]